MPQTVRVYWGRIRGRKALNFNWSAIDRNSTVIITASQWRADPPGRQADDGDQQRFVGAATIRVSNVAPQGPPSDPHHGVTFVVEVESVEALPVVTDITVLDGPPGEIVFTGKAGEV